MFAELSGHGRGNRRRVSRVVGIASRAMRWLVLLSASCVSAPDARSVVTSPNAPAAIGPYSQGIRVGATLWIAGQIGRDPHTGQLADASIETETEQALANVAALLSAAGFTLADVVQTQVFLRDLTDFERMNAVYAKFFASAAPPARATVQVAALPRNARIEVLAVAVRAGR